MSKKIYVSIIIFVVTLSPFLAGCTTAQSRKRDQRIEELERRVAKIEFDNNDGPAPGDDFSRYSDMARSAR